MSTYSASSVSDGIMTPTSSKSSNSVIDNNKQAQNGTRERADPTTMLARVEQGVKDFLVPFRAGINAEIESNINLILLLGLPVTLVVLFKSDTFYNKKAATQDFLNKNNCPANTSETRKQLDLLATCIDAGNYGPSMGSSYDQSSTQVHLLAGLLALLVLLALVKTVQSLLHLIDTVSWATDKRIIQEDGVMVTAGRVISALIMVLVNFIAVFYMVTVLFNFSDWFGYAIQHSGKHMSKLVWSLE
jgi:hypothetical protein